jgi:hypothetical protein
VKGERQRVEGSFETVLDLAGIRDFRFHDLRQRADFPVMPTFSAGAGQAALLGYGESA